MKLSDIIKKGNGVPTTSDLIVGGIGIDIDSGLVYSKKADGTIFHMGNGIDTIDLTSGGETAGDDSTYTITLDNGITTTFIAKGGIKGNNIEDITKASGGVNPGDDTTYTVTLTDGGTETFIAKGGITGFGITTGLVIIYPIATVPSGYLECNGSELSRATYSDLFAVVGTTYGTGDGTNTFNIPDLRGEFIRGYDNGRGVDSARTIGSWQEDAIRNIVGFASSFNITSGATGAFTQTYNSASKFALTGGSGYRLNFDASIVVPTASDNRPRNIAMMHCIKY